MYKYTIDYLNANTKMFHVEHFHCSTWNIQSSFLPNRSHKNHIP